MKKLAVAIFAAAAAAVAAAAQEGAHGASVIRRVPIRNAQVKFERELKGTVAYMGGSITEMNGYRPLVEQRLKKRFPKTQFTHVSAGVSSTCSTAGAFRLEEDVLKRGVPDLFFVEFAVNDDQDAHHTRENAIRGMEGIVRHARAANPKMDIVIVLFVNKGELDQIRAGKTPVAYEAHMAVAKHYGLPTVNVGVELANRIAEGTFSWERYRDCHPSPEGNAMVADMVTELLDREGWDKPAPDGVKAAAHRMPPAMDKFSYGRGRFLPFSEVKCGKGWQVGLPDWGKVPGSKRGRFCAGDTLWSETPGAECEFSFSGTAVGAFVTAGIDAGVVEVSVDGGEWKEFDLFRPWSTALHYPYVNVFAAELADGRHTVKMRMSGKRNAKSKGNAMRAFRLVVNGGK